MRHNEWNPARGRKTGWKKTRRWTTKRTDVKLIAQPFPLKFGAEATRTKEETVEEIRKKSLRKLPRRVFW